MHPKLTLSMFGALFQNYQDFFFIKYDISIPKQIVYETQIFQLAKQFLSY